MTINYEYNEELAAKGDAAASKLNETGAYVGKITRAWATESANTGTKGIELELEVPGGGKTSTTLWVERADGSPVFGQSLIQAAMYLLGLRSLKSEPGKIEKYDEEAKGRIEVDGEVFPGLCNKPIGFVLQREMYSKNNGGEGERMGLVLFYQPETRLTMTELKDRKTKPEKLEKLLRSLKDKNSRKHVDEPTQPALGGVASGDF